MESGHVISRAKRADAQPMLLPPPAPLASRTIAQPRPALKPAPALKRAAMIGNFPPRKCGIATFTRDLLAGLIAATPNTKWQVAALTEDGAAHDYPADVTQVIAQNDPQSYVDAAEAINASGAEAAFIQHEYGIFGGRAGEHVLLLMRRLRMPVIVTLHTVLERPDPDQRRVMDEIIRLASGVVVMADKGADILARVHKAGPSKVHVAPHGAPDRAFAPTELFKAPLGLSGRKVIMTFGLLSPNKGLETIIRALPQVLEQHPDATYMIVGATHPHLIAREGEAYRDGLVDLARSLGVESALHFVNRYVDDAELADMLQGADIYVTPYLNEAQITSGTLSYAVALGKPVVSTPYWHAAEALEGGVGALCGFGDSAAFAREIIALLSDDDARQAMARRAYKKGGAYRWPNVGKSYVDLALAAKETWTSPTPPLRALARPSMTAVRRLMDDCGIIQHARYRIPDRRHGYCIDDNARALALFAHLAKDGRLDGDIRHAHATAAFIEHAWNADIGRFRNFMGYDRRWLDEGGCDDCQGRTLEALCLTAAHGARQDLRDWAIHLARPVFAHARGWGYLRSRAHVIKACLAGEGEVMDPGEAEALIRDNGDAFMQGLAEHGPWFEPKLAYDNARLPEALIRAGRRLGDQSMLNAGLTALRWLMRRQTFLGHFSPVGTAIFDPAGPAEPRFDQQPIEALATIDACAAAFEATSDDAWLQKAVRAFLWFAGENELGESLVTPEDGGCFDGLTPQGCNQNQGAESVLSYHLASASIRRLLEVRPA